VAVPLNVAVFVGSVIVPGVAEIVTLGAWFSGLTKTWRELVPVKTESLTAI